MAAWLAAALLLLSAVALLLLSAVAAPAEPVADGFETETLGLRWNPRFVTPGRVSVQREVVHSGLPLSGSRSTNYFDDYRKERLAP